MVNSEVKVSTVEVESVDNMATLPVSRAHGGSSETNTEKNNATRDMELKYVQPKPDKRYYENILFTISFFWWIHSYFAANFSLSFVLHYSFVVAIKFQI